MSPLKRPAMANPNFTINQKMAPNVASYLGSPFFSLSKSHTSIVILIIIVKRPPIPKEKKGSTKRKALGLPGINKNQKRIYPIIEMP